MKKTPFVAFVAAALVLAGIALWTPSRLPDRRDGTADGPLENRTAPLFTLRDINGNMISSERFRGKPTVINFFAAWCPPCRDEIPGFVEVYNKYRGQGLEVVGIALDTDTGTALPDFIATNRIEYRILVGDAATARAYGGVSMYPTTVFVGRDGLVRNVHIGYLAKDAFEREVRRLFQEPAS